MPALYAHKSFGALVYKKLPRTLRRIVAANHQEFLLGLHGPDPLFFHITHGGDAASENAKMIHRRSFEEMYHKAYTRVSASADNGELSYFIGMICHFVLDAACHPIVTETMVDTGLSHGKVEMEFERFLIKKAGREALKYPTYAHIPVSRSAAEHAAVFYDGITPSRFLASCASMKAINGVCRINDKRVRKTITRVMDYTGNAKKIASLIMSKDESMLAKKYVKKIYQTYLDSVDTAVAEAVTFADSIGGQESVSAIIKKNFYGVN